VPWELIAALHEREAGGSFKGHLHNGDPLTGRTYHVPAGRPAKGSPPFTWEASAIDALTMAPHSLDQVKAGPTRALPTRPSGSTALAT
jgi:lysozyme family protein